MTSYAYLLRRQGVPRFMLAQGVSYLGSSAMWMVSGIWVMKLTGNPSAAATVFFFFLAPAVLAPAIGLWVDRTGARNALIACNAIGAIVIAPLFAVRSAKDIWIVYVVMFCYGAINISTGSAQSAYIVRALPSEMLASANGMLRSTQEVIKALAPFAGAAIFAMFGGVAVVAIDIVTFLVAVALLVTGDRLPHTQVDQAPVRLRHELAAGLRHLIVVPALRRMSVGCVAFMFVAGFGEAARWAILQSLALPPEFIAVLQVVVVAGAIPGGLMSSMIVNKIGEMLAMALGIAAFATGLALMTIPHLPVVIAGMFIGGTAVPLLFVAATTLLQRATPHTMQGRSYAAFELVVTVPQAVSVGLGAALLTSVGYRSLLGVAAVVCVAAALTFVMARGEGPLGMSNGAARRLDPGAEPHPAMPLRVRQDLGVEHRQEVVEEHDHGSHEGGH